MYVLIVTSSVLIFKLQPCKRLVLPSFFTVVALIRRADFLRLFDMLRICTMVEHKNTLHVYLNLISHPLLVSQRAVWLFFWILSAWRTSLRLWLLLAPTWGDSAASIRRTYLLAGHALGPCKGTVGLGGQAGRGTATSIQDFPRPYSGMWRDRIWRKDTRSRRSVRPRWKMPRGKVSCFSYCTGFRCSFLLTMIWWQWSPHGIAVVTSLHACSSRNKTG